MSRVDRVYRVEEFGSYGLEVVMSCFINSVMI